MSWTPVYLTKRKGGVEISILHFSQMPFFPFFSYCFLRSSSMLQCNVVLSIVTKGWCQNIKKPIFRIRYIRSGKRAIFSSVFRLENFDNDFLEETPGDKLLTGYATYQINGSSTSIDDLRWLRSVTKLPVILKGILKSKWRSLYFLLF